MVYETAIFSDFDTVCDGVFNVYETSLDRSYLISVPYADSETAKVAAAKVEGWLGWKPVYRINVRVK